MSGSADTAQSAGLAAATAGPGLPPHVTSAAKATDVRFGMHTATVLVYLAIAAFVLAPGALLWLVPDVAFGYAPLDASMRAMQDALRDIRFGGGIRFWFGVMGLSMMVLLLLYPLRKAMARRRGLGSVAGWFHLHLVFGIAGPVLILYHCNFGHGAQDANVALWSMLAVALSGIVGHFIYANVSAGFYADKQSARAERDAIVAALLQLDAMHPSRQTLQDALLAFDEDLLTPRRGLRASLVARYRIERRRSLLARQIGWHIGACAEQLGMSAGQHAHVRTIVAGHFGGYMRMARQASSRSVREQIWARWRLFHLPLFLIMIVAAGLHVAAVWNLNDAAVEKAAASRTMVAAPPVPVDVKAPVNARLRQNAKVMPPARTVRTLSLDSGSETVGSNAVVAPAPVLIARPEPARRPSAAAPERTVSPPPQVPPSVAMVPAARAETRESPQRSLPQAVVETNSAADPIAELQKRMDAPPMALGGDKSRTLMQQIAELKLKRQNKQFAHAESETGFALTGAHAKVECASCHTKAFEEPIKPSDTPRPCVGCHKKDDVHRGRRQNCASCHTTKNWTEIIRD